MENIQLNKDLIEKLIKISKEAGEGILEVYSTDFTYEIKEDLSPITKADMLSHNIIYEQLKLITPDIPILSEENSDIPFSIRSLWKQYWLIDPLDGTKEFINRNGEFTVNIALIKNNRPVFGLIHIPVFNETYWGLETRGSYLIDKNSNEIKLSVSDNLNDPLRIVASRSHASLELISCLEKIENYELIKVGSSLKFCLIAKGDADCYPRFGATSEWDTAAGEIIACSAGANMVDIKNRSLIYNNRKDFINPSFLVSNCLVNQERIFSSFDD